jgi:diguanylate cyclase (GGDEF)-like protein/PAS domain S-box-containing protein
MCLLAIPFAFFHAQTLQAAGIVEFSRALKWNIASGCLMTLMLAWFIAIYTGQYSRRFLAALSAVFAILLVVNFMQPYSLQYDRMDGIFTLQLPWGESVTRGKGHHGPWSYIASVWVMAAIGYALIAVGRAFHRYRRRADLWMLLGVVLFLLTVLEGLLVRLSIIDFIELGPFGTLAVVIVISIVLAHETQQQLSNSEHKFRMLFENSPTAMVAIDPKNGRIVQANHNALKMTGYNAEEILNISVNDSTHPDDQAESRKRYEQLSKGQPNQIHFEKRYRRKDGSEFIGQSSISVMKDERGNIVSFIGSTVDITERKLIEARFRAVVEQSPIGMAFARDGITVDVNAVYLKMFGYDDINELRGHSLLDQIAPQQRAEMEERIRRRMRDEQTEATYETIGLRKDGSQFPLLITAKRLVLSDGPLTFGFMMDISERKEAEANLRIAAAAFESQESMMITDANSVILRVNKAFTESTGYTADEIVGKTPRVLKSGRHDPEFYRVMWETIQRTGTWQGEIWDRRKNGEIYPKWLTVSAVKRSDGVITHYVGSHTDITERKLAEEKIQHLAFYDHLTDLPNRLLLMDRLQQATASSVRSGRPGALLFIDLDNFKGLNDTLGHTVGDLVLKEVARRLVSCVREGDTVARLGSDEFVVMLLDLDERPLEAAAEIESIGEKTLAALGLPYQIDMHVYHTTASIGVTVFSDNNKTNDELIKQADIALNQAKKLGRNSLLFFDQQMQASISARVSLEGELHNALEKQQFQLYYQVQMDSLNRTLGAEALIRWIHPEHGLVSPAQFIPLAEETGMILPIGQWVLETACMQIRVWEQNALTRDLVLAVNVSAKQFHQADFVSQIRAVIRRHAIDPTRLKLELTEGMLLENIGNVTATMNELKNIGIQMSLDDFGTGYSSLQYLKRLSLSQLKIDQSFVRDIATDPSDQAIVRTIVAMAKTLDMVVIAEGVETEDQRQILLSSGCTNYQGYLFGKPVPIDQFEALLRQNRIAANAR